MNELLDFAAGQQMRLAAWEGWLEEAAGASDCKLSSHATRALLHLRSARAVAAAEQQVCSNHSATNHSHSGSWWTAP